MFFKKLYQAKNEMEHTAPLPPKNHKNRIPKASTFRQPPPTVYIKKTMYAMYFQKVRPVD